MGADPAETALAVERVRRETGKPLIVKLTPNAAEPAAVAAAAQEAGADAVSLVNTLKGMALHPDDRRAVARRPDRRRLGPAIRAIALEQVAAVASGVEIPVIGMGGIASGRHAADFLAAGRVGGRGRHRELPRPGRRAPDRRRARRAVPQRRRRACPARRTV